MKRREMFGWLIAAALLVAVVFAYVPREETIAGDVRVVDGDSLDVGNTKVRLFGVDTFEGSQVCTREGNPWRCGDAAADELHRLTAGRTITCSKRDIDQYGRTVAVCNNGTADLGAELTRAGLALAYREFSDDYVDEEDEARATRRGAWAGEFTAPWDERRRGDTQPPQQRREDDGGASNCPDARIKGNINREGGRIYHVPGSSSYEDTEIDESKGERWFCTEEEALREGWRAPLG